MFQSREPKYWGFGRAGQPSVFGGNWRIRALFVGRPGSDDKLAASGQVRGSQHEPGKPDQNAFIERFNRSYREEVLDAYLFEDLDQVREISHEWVYSYNEERPHDALGSLPPALFRQRVTAARSSTSELST